MRTWDIREVQAITTKKAGMLDPGKYGFFYVGLCLLIGLVGCTVDEPEPPTPPLRPAPPLRVLVIDDPGLGEAIGRQWRARAETDIEILEPTTEELLETPQAGLAADAVIYPSGLLGELAERRLISPLPGREVNSPEFGRRDIFDLIRQQEIVWGQHVYAVPLGSPVLTLIYRRDIFDKLDLEPPTTWEEYQQLVRTLSDPEVGASLEGTPTQVLPGALEPLGPGWASQVLLARAAPYARHRNYFSSAFDAESMKALIDSPPFVRALEEMVLATGTAGTRMLDYDPQKVVRALRDGRCALGMAWPSAADDTAEIHGTNMGLLGFAELPGSAEVYNPSSQQWQGRERAEGHRATLLSVAGRLGSVSAASRQPQAAVSLLINLASPAWSQQISPYSPATTLFRQSQRGNVGDWLPRDVDAATAREYAEMVEQAHRRSLWLSLRIPGRDRYLQALDQAVEQVIRGEMKPQEALSQAALMWDDITSEMGVERQRAAYWRSQGMEP